MINTENDSLQYYQQQPRTELAQETMGFFWRYKKRKDVDLVFLRTYIHILISIELYSLIGEAIYVRFAFGADYGP
jgi:hypothetical protein